MAIGIKAPLLLLLFLHRVSSHHYLYHCQNMEPRYPSSKSRKPVRKNRMMFALILRLQLGKPADSVC